MPLDQLKWRSVPATCQRFLVDCTLQPPAVPASAISLRYHLTYLTSLALVVCATQPRFNSITMQIYASNTRASRPVAASQSRRVARAGLRVRAEAAPAAPAPAAPAASSEAAYQGDAFKDLLALNAKSQSVNRPQKVSFML